MRIYVIECPECGLRIRENRSMYVIDAAGRRTICCHPCEGQTVWDVLKPELHWLQRNLHDSPFSLFDLYDIHRELSPLHRFLGFRDFQALVRERTGVYRNHYCSNCHKVVQRDPARDSLICPECSSTDIVYVEDLVGRQCPQCAAGTMVEKATGMIV